ncbi:MULTISPECIES: acetolactate synthase small subunit [Helicobacter]|uniref:Acetolactate synthase small subunit n=2 Tax=Helicobacter typhlonius TaxID=76936 RepID=A0A099UGR1_9HELI|nr:MULTISPECIES: acetolactate synthase small subunit [Helicobacter]TLD78202.1 acetolactate synthase small subunit [Helicobacter typhlonius]TLD86855.1 acetolactate synthase small subunit [Helicobacter sp. MIT 03-1616]CUU40678.1 Acetolactate synthase small subunit [Helicobacter typhlonius]HCD73719.1 acetolactate synthase small subunit [Helicobacter sp.]
MEAKNKEMKKSICVNVINEHSVLARISGLFSARGYNIESLTTAPIPNSNLSRITIVTQGSEVVIEQIIKQLHKLIPVVSVISNDDLLEKEAALVKIPLSERLADIEVLCKAYNGKIVNANEKYIIVIATDKPTAINQFIAAVKIFNPKEIIRSGVIAMEK